MSSDSHPQIFDVIVVGAGVSGLHAASLLQAAGRSCLVVEARDRIGGKIWSVNRDPNASQPVVSQDYGAAWLNDTTQDRVWPIARKLGLTPIVDRVDGDLVAQDIDGKVLRYPPGQLPQLPDADAKAIVRFRQLVQAKSTTIQSQAEREELDAMSLEGWLYKNFNGNARVLAQATVMTQGTAGCDPSDVSALFFLDYLRAAGGLEQMISEGKDGGQHMRLAEGMSSIPEAIERTLKDDTVILNWPVAAVCTDGATGLTHVKVRPGLNGESPTAQHVVAREVIISIPSTCYRGIIFDPPLSPAKSAYVYSTRYNHYTKYLVTFKRRFWNDYGLAGVAQSFTGPAAFIRETSKEPVNGMPNYTFTCFLGGSFGRNWSRLPPGEKQAAVLKQIAEIFANGDLTTVQAELYRVQESPWIDEEFSGWGCALPTLPPGGITNSCWDAFVAPEGNLWFIGNEMTTKWRGYIDGALRTAEDNVAAILTKFGEAED